MRLLSSVYSFAIRRDLAETNPCSNVEKPGDNRRTRFLRPDEFRRLGAALDDALLLGVAPAAVNAIRALALTGCRKGEILSLRKRNIDPAGKCLRLDDTKTGPQLRPCGEAAMGCLSPLAERLPNDDDLLFPPGKGSGGLLNLAKPLAKICEAARIGDATAHTFRHSYATTAHELGYSELTIAGLLGHSAGNVTSRYAHHVDHALASAATAVSNLIMSRLNSGGTDAGLIAPEMQVSDHLSEVSDRAQAEAASFVRPGSP